MPSSVLLWNTDDTATRGAALHRGKKTGARRGWEKLNQTLGADGCQVMGITGHSANSACPKSLQDATRMVPTGYIPGLCQDCWARAQAWLELSLGKLSLLQRQQSQQRSVLALEMEDADFLEKKGCPQTERRLHHIPSTDELWVGCGEAHGSPMAAEQAGQAPEDARVCRERA